MSRPLKQGLDYFPHDTDAVNDDKIQSLMALYGPVGYSFYFILLERIFHTENGSITIGKPVEKAGIAKVIGISLRRFEEILQTALELNCFDSVLYNSEQKLTSNGVQKRIQKVTELREKERIRKENTKEKYKYKYKRKAKNGKPTENLKENDGFPIVKYKHGEFKNVLLTEDELKKLQDRFKDDTDEWIKTMDEGIETKGYKYNSHYLAILKWAKNKEDKEGKDIGTFKIREEWRPKKHDKQGNISG